MRMATPSLIRRVALGAITVGAVGALTTAPALAKGPHGGGTTGTTCSMNAAGVGAQLTLTGNGYSSGSSYRVEFTWPNSAGVADTATTADGSGNILVYTYAYWAGTYNASVFSTSGGGSKLASCSLTVS